MTQFYRDQVEQITKKQAADYEAEWLLDFGVEFRDPDPSLQMFTVTLGQQLTKENFNSQDPVAITVFEGSFFRGGTPGFELEDFARGAATASILFGLPQAGQAMGLIRAQLEAMHQRIYESKSPLPKLDASFAQLYASCVSLILLGEETSVWHSMMTYILGALWMLGFAYTVGSDEVRGQVEQVLLYYARMGAYNG